MLEMIKNFNFYENNYKKTILNNDGALDASEVIVNYTN